MPTYPPTLAPHPRRLVACVLAACIGLPAHAARPFVTEDAGVLDSGSCELEANLGHDSQRNQPSERSGWLQGICGLGWRTQLALGAGGARSDGSRSKALAVLAKTWLNPPSEAGPNFALAYGASSAKASGESWRHDARQASLVATLEAGGSLWGANVGWLDDRAARQHSTTWSLGWERPLVPGLDIGVDLFGDDRSGSPWLNLGLRWAVQEGVWLDAAIARQGNSARAQSLNLGLRIGF